MDKKITLASGRTRQSSGATLKPRILYPAKISSRDQAMKNSFECARIKGIMWTLSFLRLQYKVSFIKQKEITGKASKGNDGKHLIHLIVELGLNQRWQKQYVNITYPDKGCKWKKQQGKRERKRNWHFNLGLLKWSLVFLHDWAWMLPKSLSQYFVPSWPQPFIPCPGPK